jgi:hypothetical protein
LILDGVGTHRQAQHEHAKRSHQGPNVPRSIHRSRKSYWMDVRGTKRFAVVVV